MKTPQKGGVSALAMAAMGVPVVGGRRSHDDGSGESGMADSPMGLSDSALEKLEKLAGLSEVILG